MPRTSAAVVATSSAPNDYLRGPPPPGTILTITCAPDQCASPPISVKYDALTRREATNATTRLKWALALHREKQMAIGQQLRVECELPEELPPPKLTTPLIRRDREHDPYADIVGTC